MRSLFLLFLLFLSGCAHSVSLQESIWSVNSEEGSCTGFQVKGGYIVTAAHCITDKTNIVFKKDSVTVVGELRRLDPESDVAIFFSDALTTSSGLAVACYSPQFNKPLFAIGYPGALGGTLYSPQITLLDVDPTYNFLLRSLDGKVWQGMSGGPLTDEYGNVFAVITGFQLINHSNAILNPAIMKIDLFSTGIRNDLFCKNLQ